MSRVSRSDGGAFLKLIIFLAIFGGVVVAAWIFFMPLLLTSTLAKRTGFNVSVQRLTLNPFGASVEVSGLLITNPYTFPRPEYIEVRDFKARAPVKTLFSDHPEFDWVLIDISHISFVRNTDGTLNASLFYDRLVPPPKPTPEEEERAKKAAKTKGKTPPQTPPPTRRPAPKHAPFLIRRLELKVDRVTFDDHASRTRALKEYNLGIDQVFENVTGAQQLMTPAMLRALSPAATAIGALIPGDMGDVLSAAADSGSKNGANEELKSLVDTLEESRKP